jgi:hypothetical protein
MPRRFLAFLLLTGSLFGQTALRVFVEPFSGGEPSGAALREEFLQKIRKRKDSSSSPAPSRLTGW